MLNQNLGGKMKIKVKIDTKNIEVIDSELSRYIKNLDDFYYTCKALRLNGVEEKAVAEYNGMSLLEYRRAIHRNRTMRNFLNSILKGIYK